MASGITVKDECKKAFTELNTGHKYKYIVMKISDNNKEVEVSQLGPEPEKLSDEGEKEAFERFCEEELREKTCVYAVYDIHCKTKENQTRQKPVFIQWADDNAPMKSKMMFGSSVSAVKSALTTKGPSVQANDRGDLNYADIVALVGK